MAETILFGGSSSCNVVPIPASSAADPDTTASSPRISASGTGRQLRAPLYRMVAADRNARLPRPGPEDFAVSRKGVSIRCGFTRLRAIPLLGDARLRVHDPARCGKRLRARSNSDQGVAKALMLRSNRQRHVIVRVSGDRVRVRVRGSQPRVQRVHYLDQGRWKKLKVNRRGWAGLPAAGRSSLRLRVRARGNSAGVPADTANITLAR